MGSTCLSGDEFSISKVLSEPVLFVRENLPASVPKVYWRFWRPGAIVASKLGFFWRSSPLTFFELFKCLI